MTSLLFSCINLLEKKLRLDKVLALKDIVFQYINFHNLMQNFFLLIRKKIEKLLVKIEVSIRSISRISITLFIVLDCFSLGNLQYFNFKSTYIKEDLRLEKLIYVFNNEKTSIRYPP